MAELWLRPAQPKGQWVHGMSWSAVVGSHAQAVARLRARQMRASHYLLGGERAMAAGCARIRGRGVCYSAAQQVAAHCAPDAFAAVVSLDDRHWLVAVQDGAVLAGGDQVFTQEDQALAALQRLGMEPSRRPDRARQALDGAPLQAARLRPLPPRPAFMLAMLLLPLAGVACGPDGGARPRRGTARRLRRRSRRHPRYAWVKSWTACTDCRCVLPAGAWPRRNACPGKTIGSAGRAISPSPCRR